MLLHPRILVEAGLPSEFTSVQSKVGLRKSDDQEWFANELRGNLKGGDPQREGSMPTRRSSRKKSRRSASSRKKVVAGMRLLLNQSP